MKQILMYVIVIILLSSTSVEAKEITDDSDNYYGPNCLFDERLYNTNLTINMWERLRDKYGYSWEFSFVDPLEKNQTPLLYAYIHQNEIAREHFEEATKYLRRLSFSDEDIDILYSGDIVTVRKHFKSNASFFCEEDGYLYNLYDLPLCDEGKLINMDKNGELTLYLEYMLDGNLFGPDMNICGGLDEYWDGDNGWSIFYEIHGTFIINTLELLNPGKTYKFPEHYSWLENAPQTGTPIVPLTITATAALATTIVIQKKKRVKNIDQNIKASK